MYWHQYILDRGALFFCAAREAQDGRKTAARDYFQAPLGQKAREELRRAEEAMARFAELAMQADNPTLEEDAADNDAAHPPRLRPLNR